MANENKVAPEQSSLDSVRFAEQPKEVSCDQFMVEHLGSVGRYQLLQFILVCIPSAFLSMHVMSWTFVSIPSDKCSDGENCIINGYYAADRSLYYIGHMVGATLWGIVSDKFGRKNAYCIAITTQILCGLVLIIAPTWWLFDLELELLIQVFTQCLLYLQLSCLVSHGGNLAAVGAGIFYATGELILAGLAYLIRDYRALHAAFVVGKVFRTQKLKRRILAAIFVWPVYSMVYYGLTMKSDIGGGSLYVNFAISAAMEVHGLIALYLLMGRVGRRPLISGCLAISGICLVLIGPLEIMWGMAQIAIAKGAISVSYNGMYTYTSLFPTVMRSTAVGCCSTASRIGAVATSYVALWLVDEYGKLTMVNPFSLLALISAALTALFLPETMNKPLPATIDELRAKKFSLFCSATFDEQLALHLFCLIKQSALQLFLIKQFVKP